MDKKFDDVWMDIYCNIISRLENKDIDLWLVKNNKGYIKPYYNMTYEYYSDTNIPIEDIKLVEDDKWPIIHKARYPNNEQCKDSIDYMEYLEEQLYSNGNLNELYEPMNIA